MTIDKYIQDNISTQKGRTFIVSGANSGIGFELSKLLLSLGAKVVFACRNENRALKAISTLDNEEQKRASFIPLDMSDFASIDAFLEEITKNYADFDGLILNAGILKPKEESYTKQGFKSVVGTNFIGAYYLVEKLNKIENINDKKIIFQSSLMARRGRYKDDELNTADSRKFHAYNISKMGIDLYFLKLIEEQNRKHNYYLCEPGACYSNIYSSFPKIILPLANGFMKLVFHSAKKGSLTALSLACNDYKNGSVLIPRGPFAFSGFPKKSKVANKIKKSRNIMRDVDELTKQYL